MQRIVRAPLLSATLTTVSCWITSLGLLEDFCHAPPLLLRERACFGDAHTIADVADSRLVVDLEAPRRPHHLLVKGMRLEVLHDHDRRLLHLVADDNAVAHLAPGARSGLHVTHPRLPRSWKAPRWASVRVRPRRATRPCPRHQARESPHQSRPEPSADGVAPASGLQVPPALEPAVPLCARCRARAPCRWSWHARSRVESRESGGGFRPVPWPSESGARRAWPAARGRARATRRRPCHAPP